MFKHCLIIFFVFLATVAGAWADARDFECKKDGMQSAKAADSELAKAQDAYNAITGMHAHFVQDSFLAALEISEVSSGDVWFSKPGKMKWVYTKPEKQTFTVKDETLWLYQEADKQLVIDRFSKVLISDLPVAFLLGIGDLSKSFNIVSACRNVNGSGIYFNLSPKLKAGAEKDDGLKSFELVVSTKTSLPAAARVHDLGANVNIIYLENVKVDNSIPEETFNTEYPAGIDIDDRRKNPARK